MDRTIIYAHRGASGYSPENTISSFHKGIELGANGIELDVHLSKDGEIIVCHDGKVNRTTNGRGYIRELNLKQLKKLDAGSWFSKKYKGEKLPTLKEVFEVFNKEKMLINIEIKNIPFIYPDIEKKVIELVESFNAVNRVTISSFNHYSLLEIKKINPKIKTGALYMAGLIRPWKYAQDIGVDAINTYMYNIIAMPSLVKQSIDNGIEVNAFTVNELIHIKKILETNLTGIITDFPDRVVMVRGKMSNKP
ncbi:glycerophosphodiester phosphodiesterase [Alkalibaculum sp. M08DMB]|uniref:Glycerophosphodiester phosphodiesterase n=1 Tax=Alkalibaculum sporogenes TaxID=2655001 RepID=A0A6A7KAU1_9FIRM|nr:glycerophosphodiester phosphodiesterase [Alkalibaculum sporogenes]MPW26630.1 glycerophosphodiester phosphodiesterase [Alkalibaculum sporogenes]